MSEQRRMSTAVAEDLASRRRKVQNAAMLLARQYDELVDVPMRYWTEGGHQWRKKVLAAREELKELIGEEAIGARRTKPDEEF